MSPREIIVYLLLALAALIVLASSVGILVMRDAYQKLHYVTPAAVVAPVVVGVAVLVQSGFTEDSAQTWLALVFVLADGPVLAHATIRAARIRAEDDWRGGLSREHRSGHGRAQQAREAAATGQGRGGGDD
jgi:multisubunit Na+/H+ antiporter MnhG subunit